MTVPPPHLASPVWSVTVATRATMSPLFPQPSGLHTATTNYQSLSQLLLSEA
jgi:hypothetical protein